MLVHFATRRQLLRYAAVGVASNAALYAAYLLLSALGLGPKTAMSTVYAAGVLMTFLFNRRWTFGHSGAIHSALVRYTTSYGLMYVVNVAILQLLVAGFGFPHEWVVLILIVASAGVLFLLQKFWVFSGEIPSKRRI